MHPSRNTQPAEKLLDLKIIHKSLIKCSDLDSNSNEEALRDCESWPGTTWLWRFPYACLIGTSVNVEDIALYLIYLVKLFVPAKNVPCLN